MGEMKPRLVWAAEYDDESDYLSVMERLDTQGRHEGVTICRLHGEASADLIAEAGTVHHETGLTPRQLVERVKELEEALQKIIAMNQQWAKDQWGDALKAESMSCVKVARAALAKCQPKPQEGQT